jgi:hypothetical protein
MAFFRNMDVINRYWATIKSFVSTAVSKVISNQIQ